MCKNSRVARLPIDRWSENAGPRSSTPSGGNRAPTMDEQERRLPGRAEPEGEPVREVEPTLEETIEALKRRWGAR